MEFTQLEYFCTVAETGSVTRAAKRLHISQPSLSQTISRLEKELNTAVFERVPRGVILTGAGKSLYRYAKKALSDRQDIITELNDMADVVSGEIRVKVNAVSYIIARLYYGFKALYPNITVQFSYNNYLPNAFSEKDNTYLYDLFITSNPSVPRSVDSAVLFTENLFAVFPAGHAMHDRSRITLEELAGEDFILIRGGELRGIIDNLCREADFTPKIALECDNTNTLFGLITMGMGVSLMPMSWRMFCGGNMAFVQIDQADCSRTVRITWDKGRRLSKAAVLFRDYIISNITLDTAGYSIT